MKIAVIYQNKKFIVVVPNDSSVSDLKAEIERVHCALFQSSGPPEQVREIRTLGGCLLYGGYKVLSVLNDSETVIASSSGEDEAESTRDSLSHTLSPYPLPYYGFNPVGYHSPMGVGHMISSPYNFPQSHLTPPKFNIGLFHSPPARSIGSQCPSPELFKGDIPQSQPHHSREVGGGDLEKERMSLEESIKGGTPQSEPQHRQDTTSVEDGESESPLGNTSLGQTRGARPQKRLFSAKTTSAVSESSDSASADRRSQKVSKHKKPESGSVNSENTNMSEGDKSKVSPPDASAAPLVSNPNNNQTREKIAVVPLQQEGKVPVSPTLPLSRHRKKVKSESSVTSAAKRTKKEVAKKTQSAVGTDESSDWMSSDESVAGQEKDKISSSETGKSKPTKPAVAKSMSLKKPKPPPPPPPPPGSDTSSEWETDDDVKTTSSAPTQSTTVTASVSAVTQKTNDSKEAKNQKPTSKLEGGAGGDGTVITNPSSSSDWSTDEEDVVTVLETQKEQSSAQTKTKGVSKVNAHKKKEKAGASATGEKSAGAEAKEDSGSSTSKAGGRSDTGELMKSWSQASTVSSPTKIYTAHNGRRMKQKRLENFLGQTGEVVSTTPAAGSASTDSLSTLDSDKTGGAAVIEPGGDAERAQTPSDGAKKSYSEPHETLKEESDEESLNHEVLVLAPNSVPSDEEMEETLQQQSEEVRVIAETQEHCDHAHSPSPEIPFLGCPPHQTSSPQKMRENATSSSATVDLEGDRDGDGDRVQEKCDPAKESETDRAVSDYSTKTTRYKKRKKSKNKDTESVSDNPPESSDATASADSQTSNVSRKQKGLLSSQSKETQSDPSSSESNSSKPVKGRIKTKSKRSRLDCDEDKGTLHIPCEGGDSELPQTKQKKELAVQAEAPKVGSLESADGSCEETEVDHEATAAVSDTQQTGRKKHKKTKRKSKSTSIIVAADEDDMSDATTATKSSKSGTPHASDKTVVIEPSERESERETCEALTTENDVTDLNSDAPVTQSQITRKRKRKQKKREIKLSNSQVDSDIIDEGLPPSQSNAREGDQKEDGDQNEKVEEDEDEHEESSGVSEKPGSGLSPDDVFVKPTAIPSLKSSTKSQSPAARLSQSSRGSPTEPSKRTKRDKGSSLLSAFSVTETEMSSEESSTERMKATSRARHEKKARKYNFLSSLGTLSKGKKVYLSRPFSRTSSLVGPSPSRLSSDTAARMFSLTHSAHRPRPRLTPPKPKKKPVENEGPSPNDPLIEDVGKKSGRSGGGKESSSVSVSDLLSNGSLWDS